MGSSKFRTAAAVAGGVAVVGALLYYLFRDDSSENKDESNTLVEASTIKDVPENTVRRSLDTFTKEDMLLLLDEILESQNSLKKIMRSLTNDFVADPPKSLQDCYNKVKDASPQDPLDKRKISLVDFDRLVERFYNDEGISSAIEKIMGIHGPGSITERAGNIGSDQLIKVNEFMLKELREFVDQYIFIANKDQFDVKTLTIAAQVWVGSKVEKQFNLSSDDIETAMLLHSQTLRNDPDFGRISFQMQATMEQLLGSPAPTNLPFSI
ncbi:apicomplexa specific secreted protein [Cryptosporidium sp. chipmunk genotype I]|uniref:apicomplexa specific secreted protein n=1 Tax=Cryptosporidium sp. chipmunk genotype I TaxID=1280935 RepID=UPI00351A79EB|nr:apicomplexa specific secreted protein [Cryptosporidium sp. chipmunk genotype I]